MDARRASNGARAGSSERPPVATRRSALAVALAMSVPTAAHAQQEDVQQWTLLSATGRVSGDVVVYAEVQPRFTDDVSRAGQLLIRPAIGVQVDPDVQLLLGYAYVRTAPLGGRATDEHRVWQQLLWTAYRGPGGLTLASRTRLEQRTVVGADDLGWRLRQQLRAQAPIRPGSKLQAVAWTEPFYNLDATDWGQRRGFDQVRSFIGLGVPVAAGLTAEPGYLNQTVFRRGQDRVNHVASVTLAYRF